MAQVERDFPIGHPAAVDTVLGSKEHLAWIEQHKFVENARDFPPGHPKAVDTPGHLNATEWHAGVDPHNPHLEPFTGRLPEAAAAAREYARKASAGAYESPALEPVDANVANAALEARRKELKVDYLTAEQHAEVMAELHKKAQA